MEESLKRIGYLLEMEKRKEGYNQYILSAKNLLNNFTYPKKPFTISFVDKDGVLLLSFSDGKVTIPEEGFTFEDNSIKTAIKEALENGSNFEVKRDGCSTGKPKGFSCAASPIKDELGNVIGAISISAPNSSYPVFALEILSLLANTIQNEVNLSNHYDNSMICKTYEEVIPDSYNDGILLLDKDKKVLFINNTGASILKIDRKSSIGKQVIDIVDFTPVVLNVFKTGKGYFDKEFFIESRANGLFHFVKTAIVLKDDCGNFTGVIDLFREVERNKEIKYSREIENKCIGADARFTFDDIKGKSRAMKDLIKTAKKVANSSSNILLTGETGTGKEMFAQAIHFESSRNKGLNRSLYHSTSGAEKVMLYSPRVITAWENRFETGIWTFSLWHHFTADRFYDDNALLSPFQTVDVQAGVNIPAGKQLLNVQLALYNLTGTAYELIRLYPMPGRYWSVKMNWLF